MINFQFLNKLTLGREVIALKKILEVCIVKAGEVRELTLSKKSTPGDGVHGQGVKGMSRT